MDLLACPECGAFPLEITNFKTEADPPRAMKGPRCSAWCSWLQGSPPPAAPCSECYAVEITEGMLRCNQCHAEYPVVDGIPRFNPDADRDFPEFFRQYAARFSKVRSDVAEFRKLHDETKQSFGFQWLRYRVSEHQENREHFFRRTETDAASLAGRLFFEAGCGMGRYLKVIGDEPMAEAVGLDLSRAVERARSENRQNPFIHVIQGNIMQLPLRPETFDHVYSIGVLHHTPDTKAAFLSIVRLAKPGGRVSIWVYHVWRPPDLTGFKALHATLTGWITDGVRIVTTRLPFRVLNALCYIAAPLGWVQRRIMASPEAVRVVCSPVLLLYCSRHPQWRVRLLDTFDWYSPRYQWKHTVAEVEGWYREAGLTQISSKGFPVSVRGTRPNAASRADGPRRPIE